MIQLHRILEVLMLTDARSNKRRSSTMTISRMQRVIDTENGPSEMAPETTAVIIQKVLDKHFEAIKTLVMCYWE